MRRLSIAAVLGVLSSVTACDDNIPSFLRTDNELQYNVVGGERLAVPANYIDSQSVGSMLVMATWPEMEGRTKQNYPHFFDSHISIHARPGGPKALDASFRVFLMGEGKDGKHLKADPIGSAYGFEHAVIRFEGADPTRAYTHRDIYVRRDENGNLQAVMRCSGVPAPEGRHPQCKLFEIFPEFPQIEFAISFDRFEKLDQVNAIERAVKDKFVEFNKAGRKSYAIDRNAREAFTKIEHQIADQQAGDPVYPNRGERAGKWFAGRHMKSGEN